MEGSGARLGREEKVKHASVEKQTIKRERRHIVVANRQKILTRIGLKLEAELVFMLA